ncbi:hypothetical protein EVG20_g288 [Dentipellis fragilis]|uniref:Cyclin-like domain-containing protein n=1 Tax=Dentipellis fragilis TaxID=205917 RepID=A0A4Y9ZFE2_9AGAM|nr:hypothetical protein EVG20_g288 [Dentipellis fragilis]
MSSQWLFSVDDLRNTPTALERSLEDEMYDRARGIEFLFRLGGSIGLHIPGIFTAATWFHRFFMRYSMEDYHRQDVAASCIFLATKTEECGRKLRDVARVYCAKVANTNVRDVPEAGQRIDDAAHAILQTEEVLLEALCFDFVVDSPHADLVDLFEAQESDPTIEDYAWSIAHDSYRTPLCVLYPPKVIASACYILAQHIADGPHSLSLEARTSLSPPSASLPTPPTHKPASPDRTRFAIEFFGLSQEELVCVRDSLTILLEFYRFQDAQHLVDHLGKLASVVSPVVSALPFSLYRLPNAANATLNEAQIHHPTAELDVNGRTPDSTRGGSTPAKALSHATAEDRTAEEQRQTDS